MAQGKSIAHGRRWVGGTGRPALYLKVGPPGLGLRPYHGPRGLKPPGGRIYTLTRHSRPPGTPSRSFISFPSKFPFMSLHFLPLHCRFSSLHFLEDSFIRIPFPFRPCIFLQLGFSPAPSSFSCNAFDLHFVHFQSLLFPFSPLFRIASMHSIIRIIRDDAGNAGGVVQY